ncbi:probable serine/threonine-protein kinase MARK-A [Varroa jacobsoni]|uniref:probable serine/threonine-protein kinase MARK-A n=1 Tax=Varroa jacobsoni TaxID=62625 RepID=UPI000BF65202|nr:probable serine/threonine-protein kinase MARK-A [Varroa jacobsoni]
MSSVSSRYESPRDERQMFWLRGCTHWLLRSVAAAAAAIGMAVQELNCLAQAVAVASMAATETQRFGLNVVLRKFPEPRPRTYPVYDRLQQTVRYSQVLNDDQLTSLILKEKEIWDVLGVARSLHIIRLDESRSAVIFGEDRDHLQTVVSRLVPRSLPPDHVRSYLAQMCAICEDLHARGFTLQGALQLSSFALDKCDHVFLLSSTGVQKASNWRPVSLNPQYTAPEVLRQSLQLREDVLEHQRLHQASPFSTPYNSFSCDTLFHADAYSVGICGLVMATGKRPFRINVGRSTTAEDWIQMTNRLVLEIPNDLAKDLRCLLSHLLLLNPERRMSVSEALHHPALHAFVGHLRRSPTVTTPPFLSFMQTTTPTTAATAKTTENSQDKQQRQRHAMISNVTVDSVNTEVLIPQTIDHTSNNSNRNNNCRIDPDPLSLNEAIMPASPEGSDQDEACCEANEISGGRECQQRADIDKAVLPADRAELVTFVVDAVGSSNGDDDDNNNNNTDETLTSLSLTALPISTRREHFVREDIIQQQPQQNAVSPQKLLLSQDRPTPDCCAEAVAESGRQDGFVVAVENCSPTSVSSVRQRSLAGHTEDVTPEDSDVGSVENCDVELLQQQQWQQQQQQQQAPLHQENQFRQRSDGYPERDRKEASGVRIAAVPTTRIVSGATAVSISNTAAKGTSERTTHKANSML